MYNKLTIVFFLLFTVLGFSQFTVEKVSDGAFINDGDVFTFNSTVLADSSFEFVVRNTSDHEIDVVIYVESITNTSGRDMELCFGVCYSGIALGVSYPNTNPTAYHLPVGGQSEPHGNHMYNQSLGDDTTQPVEYVFKFHEVDASGAEIGTPVTMTYRYDATANVTDFSNFDWNIYPTLVHDNILHVTTSEELSVSIVDYLGRTVKSFSKVNANDNEINLQGLEKGIYFVIAENSINEKSTKRIILK